MRRGLARDGIVRRENARTRRRTKDTYGRHRYDVASTSGKRGVSAEEPSLTVTPLGGAWRVDCGVDC